jgi:succinate-acetate transporter protein
MAEETKAAPAVADPAPLGLAAFAATTFVLSAHNVLGDKSLGLLVFVGPALFYGSAAQFAAGMWEFKNKNVFGATAFTTFAAFWMGLAAFVGLVLAGKEPAADIESALAYTLIAFAIFNTYVWLWSARTSKALFGTFTLLEVTFVLLIVANFNKVAAGDGLSIVGGYAGIATAIAAWYCSAAALINAMAGKVVLPVGIAIWGATATPVAASATRAQTTA